MKLIKKKFSSKTDFPLMVDFKSWDVMEHQAYFVPL